MNKIALVANNAVAQTGGAEIVEYTAYLKKKYCLTDEAIKNYAIDGKEFRPSGSGYTNIWQLYEDLEKQFTSSKNDLPAQDVNYDRIKAYDTQMKDLENARYKEYENISYASDQSVIASIDSVLSRIGMPFEAGRNLFDNIGHNDPEEIENYFPMTSANMDATNMSKTVRDTVNAKIDERTDWSPAHRNRVKTLYNAGMNISDIVYAYALFSPCDVYFMGMCSCAEKQKDILDNGGTNRQALMGGMAAGATEILFDKVGVDKLLKKKEAGTIKDTLIYYLKKEGIEGANSSIQEIVSIISATSIMAGSSDYKMSVKQYQNMGLDEKEAKEKAYLDMLGQVSQAYVDGAITGDADYIKIR